MALGLEHPKKQNTYTFKGKEVCRIMACLTVAGSFDRYLIDLGEALGKDLRVRYSRV